MPFCHLQEIVMHLKLEPRDFSICILFSSQCLIYDTELIEMLEITKNE